MDALKAELAEFQSLKDLKPLLAGEGPCLSAYVPLSPLPPNQSAKANLLLWKSTAKTLEEKLKQYGGNGRELLASIADWDAVTQGEQPQGQGVAAFRSPDVFRFTWIEEPVKSRAVAGPNFYIRPLLPELTNHKTFYLLALSKKNVRMLRCTLRRSEEIPFPAGTVANYEEWMNTAKPDHVSAKSAATGPSSGGAKGPMSTTSVERETQDQYVAHFYRQIDRGVNELLRGHVEPLVLVAVEQELALYRDVNTYPNLARETVQGAPNSLKAGEMHARAINALLRCYENKVDSALSEYDHKAGGGATNRLKEVLKAAHEGRVLTLMVSDSLEATGSFDENTYVVKGRETGTSGDQDLVNDAVVQTILHAGQVLVAPNGKMPNGAPAAAIYRF
ncbi:MAG: hypothetical protein ACRD3Y_03420 [Bryobacteraceae bacterium]